MIGIPLAWAYGHVAEWAIHRWVLHGAGKRRGAPFSFHFHEHHRASRTNNFIDPVYQGSPFQWNAAGKETLALGLLTLAHIPLLPIAPWFTVTLFASGVQYYRVHKRSHLDTDWAREHIPWHYDHHMGPDQDANWGGSVGLGGSPAGHPGGVRRHREGGEGPPPPRATRPACASA